MVFNVALETPKNLLSKYFNDISVLEAAESPYPNPMMARAVIIIEKLVVSLNIKKKVNPMAVIAIPTAAIYRGNVKSRSFPTRSEEIATKIDCTHNNNPVWVGVKPLRFWR
jgi:hypothetical protein